MTKLKNTKKGMAKKALSISLVAAMLATSNVPVWAAEDLFSDGSAAVEAPVVEEPADVVVEEETLAAPLSSTITESDVKVSLEVDKSSLVWGNKATITGSVTKADGSSLGSWKYRWVDENGDVVQDKNGDNQYGTTSNAGGMSLFTDEAMAGKVLTLRVYNDTSDAQYDIDTGIKVTVEKKALTKISLVGSPTSLPYNGFSQSIDASKVVVKVYANNEATEVTVPAGKTYWTVTTDSAKNANDTITLTATAEADSPYEGTVSTTAATITKKMYANGDIIANTEKGQSYQYTGNDIVIDKSKVSLKESERTDLNKNGLSGADLSKAITKAQVANKTVGDHKVKVYFDNDKLDNIDAASKVGTGFETEETVKITKRDLSTNNTKVTVTNGTVKVGTNVNDFKTLLNFTDVNSKELLSLGNNYTITVVNADNVAVSSFDKAGTYTVTIKGNGTVTENEQTFTVEAAAAVLTGMEWSKSNSYKPSYTGNEIKPTAEDLGELTVKYVAEDGSTKLEKLGSDAWKIAGYTNNINAATYDASVDFGNINNVYDVDNTETCAYVNIEITKGSFAGTTYAIPFVIAPLKVEKNDITVQSKVNYDKDIVKAEEYALPVTVIAKDYTKKQVVKSLDAKDFSVKYTYKTSYSDGKPNNRINNYVQTEVTVTNPNYIWGTADGKTFTVAPKSETQIVARQLTDEMVQVNPSSYTYTGGKIEPTYAVVDGALVLYKKGDVASGEEEYEEVRITDALNVGTGTIVVKGLNSYSGEAKGTFTITPADTKDVKVEIKDQAYTGRQVRPRDFTATLNGNNVTDQFEIVSYGTNVEAGTGTVVLKPVSSTKNFTGANITAEFNIVKEQIEAELAVKDDKGFDITSDWTSDKETDIGTILKSFTFDGNEKTFAKVVINNLTKKGGGKTTATVDDLEIKYVDNISGKKTTVSGKNVAYVYAVAKEGTGFAGTDTITTADGTVIKGVVAKKAFAISSVEFVKQNVTVKNATYAAGLPVKPEVLVQIGGNTLVEGKDYTVKLVDSSRKEVIPTDVTVSNIYRVIVTGINGYEGSIVDGVTENINWGVDKKNLSDCNVTAKDGVVTVLNGYIPVPTTEYTVKENEDKTYTVTANKESKNYTGSKTVVAEGQKPEEGPEAPVISEVKVVGNKATVVLSGESDGATGYDYVISTVNNYTDGRLPNGINKNQLSTETSYQYLDQGIYYAYCHAWKRVNGVKVFSEWSNIYPFAVNTITPEKPVITKLEKSSNGKHLRVTWTKSANATGYDVVMGTKVQKVNGEYRPVEYGKAVKKVTNGNTVSVIFYNIPKGTYYVGLHAYNRTSDTGVKVFSPWSNSKKVTF